MAKRLTGRLRKIDDLSQALRGMRVVVMFVFIICLWCMMVIGSAPLVWLWERQSDAGYGFVVEVLDIFMNRCVELFGLFVIVMTGGDVKNFLMHRNKVRADGEAGKVEEDAGKDDGKVGG